MHFFLSLWWKACVTFLNPPPYLVGLPCTHTQRWAFLGSVGGKIPPSSCQVEPGHLQG